MLATAGCNLGEQDGLRAIDLFLDRGFAHVNGAWVRPRHDPGVPWTGKNHVIHEVPLPNSVLTNELLPRVRQLLGLPADASLQRVINAQEAERKRREELPRESPIASSRGGTIPCRPRMSCGCSSTP